MKKMSLKLTAAAMSALMAAGTLGGIPAFAEEETTIRILTTNPLVSEEAMALFEEQNPGIKVDYEYVSRNDYSAKFSALAAAGEVPDVFWTQSAYIKDQVDQGLLMDISEDLKGQNYEEDAVWEETFIEALMDNYKNAMKVTLGEDEEGIYGVPFSMTTIAVLYDKNLYDELGLTEPQDWDTFMSNCESLKEAGYVPLSLQVNWLDWYARLFWDQYCREELEADPAAWTDGTMTFESESVKKGLEAYKDLWDKGYLPENGITAELETMQQMFCQKKLAQFLIAPDKLEYILENAPEDMSLATFAFPGIAGLEPRSLGGSSNIFGISSAAENKDAALKLVKFLTSKTMFTSSDVLKYSNSGLNNVEADPQAEQLMAGFTKAAEGGFCPETMVPTTLNTEINEAFMKDLLPNYLLGDYDLDYVTSELQTIYEDTKG